VKKSKCIEASKKANLTEADLLKLTKTAKDAAQRGGEVLMAHLGKIKSLNSKSNEGDLVTNADLAAEDIILNFLNKSTPHISILSEESGLTGCHEGLKWCVDPLDGTTNFAHGYPFFATSIGLTWNSIPILGCIEVPFLRETYWGCPGIGAFCNDKALSVSSTKKLSESLMVTGFAYDRKTRLDNNYAEFCTLTHISRGVRRGGAAAVDLAFMAAGRVDAYWERGLAPWDLAAGVPIVELAGGEVSDYRGMEFDLNKGKILACSPGIKTALITVLKNVKPLKGEMFGAPEVTTIGT